MGDAVRGRVGESGEHVVEHAEHLGQTEVFDTRAQRAAFDVFHRDVGVPVRFVEVVDGDDVGMLELRDEARFGDEAFCHRGIAAGEREPLEGDLPVQGRLVGEIDRRHPAAAQHADDFVAADALCRHCRLMRTLTSAEGFVRKSVRRSR